MQAPKRPLKLHFSDYLCLLAVLFLTAMAWPLLQSSNEVDWLLAAILLAGALRFVFEVTFNRHNVPTMASGYFAQQAVVAELQAHATGKASYMVVDFGSGHGSLAKRIARSLPQANVLGIESARWPYLYSKFMQRLTGPNNLSFQQANFMQYDCRALDATVMFLDNRTTRLVGEKLRAELPSGALVICNHFKLSDDWQLVKTITPPYSFGAPLYVYMA